MRWSSKDELFGDFDDVIGKVFGPDGVYQRTVRSVVTNPAAVRAWTKGEDVRVTVDVPGVDPKDIKVRVVDNEIRVEAVRDEEELIYTARVPHATITQENITASVANGVVTIEARGALPKEHVNEFDVPLSS